MVSQEPEPTRRRILVLNGPNLARLGSREPEIYGSLDYDSLAQTCQQHARTRGLTATVRQTDSEAELIAWVFEAIDEGTAIVINPAAFTHYSYSLRDALSQHPGPVVEVHISQPGARETFRHTSVVAGVVTGTISGFGADSYRLAIDAVARLGGAGDAV